MENRVVYVNLDRLTELANAKGLNIKQLEDESGLSNGTIGKWKKANGTPTVSSLYKVADFLETSMDYFLDLENTDEAGNTIITPVKSAKPKALKDRKTIYKYCAMCGRKL